MCGINGFVGTNSGKLTAMNEAISHRGPDWAGVFADENVVLGHRLLAIRSGATESRQPFERADSPWVLLFNGQLYNTKQMRSELGCGAAQTELDTALLFALIHKHGWNFIQHIHGMFTVALYNKQEKQLRLYRDPSGQKVLYYYHHDNEFIFSSEIKPLLEHNIDKTVDEEAVAIAAAIGYIPDSKTLMQHVNKLFPSEVVTYDVASKKLSRELFIVKAEHYYDDCTPDEIFTNLVDEHLQSKQDISINLSGGLDSSLLAYETHKLGKTIKAFSTTFEDCNEKFNRDAQLAKRLAQDYGFTHEDIVVNKKTFLEHFVRSYETIEEPNYNISVPTYYQTACREGINGEGLRVVLSGDGGDEVFGGYPHHQRMQRIWRFKKMLSTPIASFIKNLRSNERVDWSDPAAIWYHLRGLRHNYATNKKAQELAFQYVKESVTPFIHAYQYKTDDLSYSLLLERAVWVASENFIRSDKLYMDQSMEMRCPLSYHPFRLHMDRLLKPNEYTTTIGNKIWLRNLYDGKLPDYITKRADKTGWRAPIMEWYDEDYKKLFLDIITDAETLGGNLIDWTAIKQKIESTDDWPGKRIHLYLSLALLAKKYQLAL